MSTENLVAGEKLYREIQGKGYGQVNDMVTKNHSVGDVVKLVEIRNVGTANCVGRSGSELKVEISGIGKSDGYHRMISVVVRS